MADPGSGGAGNRAPRFDLLIQDSPSLDWVVLKYTGEWIPGGETIRCPLPGHDDVDPSFNLWNADENGVAQSFGCFGCGRKGGVVEFISLMEGISFEEALATSVQMAQEERDDDTKHERRKPKPQEDVDLEATLLGFTSQFGPKELSILERFLEMKNMDGGEAFVQFLVEEWQWTAGNRRVVIPHRDRNGKLTAIKFRFLDGGRAAVKPAAYPSLYGGWRDKGKTPVVLCEGETDTVWADWQLRDEDAIALGLPSGADQAVAPEWLVELGDRPLVLAFDSDAPGMRAARRWFEVRPDALLARLPEGEDLLSSGIPLRELLEKARSPVPGSGMIAIANGLLAKTSQQGTVPIADFALKPTRELSTDEGPAWEVRMTGSPESRLIRASDLHTNTAITKWANKNGGSWFGTGTAPQGVFNWLLAQSSFLPLERATTKAGKIGRSFVGPGFCIGPDKLRYVNPTTGDPKLESKLRIEPGTWDPQVLVALENLNDPSTMATIIGWLCASLLRGRRAPAPPLFVSGESGAGKTSMLSTVLRSFGFDTETNLTTTTPYGVDCMVNSCVGFPVWFDEYRGGAREDSMMRLRQFLRDAYYGQPSLKGGMTHNATELTEVSTWAGIVVSGEMSSRETSHRDRMIMLDIHQKTQRPRALKFLAEPGAAAGLGYSLLTFLAWRPDVLFQIHPKGPEDSSPRYRDALGFIATGWDAWKHFRWEQGLRDTPAEPDYRGLGEERKQSEDPWIEAIKACEGVTDRNGTPIVAREGDDVVIIPMEVIVEARRVGIELPARANELVAWLKNRWTVEETRTAMGRRAKRVRGMDL